jgi:ribosomal protein S18 acetylase RimI-like enzyme
MAERRYEEEALPREFVRDDITYQDNRHRDRSCGMRQTRVMEIRVLGPSDAAAYWNVRLEGLELEPSAFGMSAEEFRQTTVEEMQTRLRDMPANSFYLGAFDGEVLVGIATFVRETRLKEQHKGHIYGVYVTASHRSRGVGRALIAALLERTRSGAGLDQILLAVATSREPAVRLYRSFGFEVYGTEPKALKIGSVYVDEHYMILRIR